MVLSCCAAFVHASAGFGSPAVSVGLSSRFDVGCPAHHYAMTIQDLLMHLALEEGCLKAGQRYWACFALRQVASRLSADNMRRLLASDAQHSPHIEDGAILLVGFEPD